MNWTRHRPPNAQHHLLLVWVTSRGPFSHLTGAKPLVFGFSVVVDNALLIASDDSIQSATAELMQQPTAVVDAPIFLVLSDLVCFRLTALVGLAELMEVASYGHMRNIKFFRQFARSLARILFDGAA